MAIIGNTEPVRQGVTRLGLGGSSLPADPETAYRIITEALGAGIPYVDMASRYVNHQGVTLLSQVLRHNPRAAFTFGYKYPHWTISSEREFSCISRNCCGCLTFHIWMFFCTGD